MYDKEVIHNDKVDSVVSDIKDIVSHGRMCAYTAVSATMIETYWHIGRRIVTEEQRGYARAVYGEAMIDVLAKTLTRELGNGFSARYLRAFRQFYIVVPDYEKWKARFPNLTWSHIFRTLRVGDRTAILWYLEQASTQMWSTRTLDRNISTQYFERHLALPVPHTTQQKERERGDSIAELIKSPVVAEFLGLGQSITYSEAELETAIIDHLQEFLMELGRGFAFLKRQQLVRTETTDYYIDLVFYNVILKCYVLIDLKVGKITHQDVGQMDMYVRMYDEMKRTEGDNPTIGIVLCSETDESIARYSILKGNEQLFATKYKLYLPTEEQLRKEIERQKEFYRIQHA